MLKNTGQNMNGFLHKKGFTLVELMIVIAVVALLILVLVPRIGVIKNKAKEAGLRANKTMLIGIFHSVIEDYDVSTNAPADVEARIAADIAAATAGQNMRNPFTGGTDVDVESTQVATTSVAAYSADDDAGGAAIDTEWTSSLANSAGTIAYAVYESAGKYYMKIIPYGADNNRITAMEETINE